MEDLRAWVRGEVPVAEWLDHRVSTAGRNDLSTTALK
jgi:hypothetical protein